MSDENELRPTHRYRLVAEAATRGFWSVDSDRSIFHDLRRFLHCWQPPLAEAVTLLFARHEVKRNELTCRHKRHMFAPRFRSTVSHYLAGRPNYAPALIWIVNEHLHLTDRHRLLDLGCGPGWLGIAFAPSVGSVLAVDPEPAMLEAAGALAAEANVRIELMEGSSYDLGSQLGMFNVVTIGRAFHWMDRADVLRRLDALIEPDGAVILFSDAHPDVPTNNWHKRYMELVDRYANRDACIPPERLRHETILLESSFGQLVRIGVIERRVTPLERLVDRALSMSTSSPEQLGPLSDQLAQELLTQMSPFATDGSLEEVIEFQALIAQRRGNGNDRSVLDASA